jgi:hypothetical protein
MIARRTEMPDCPSERIKKEKTKRTREAKKNDWDHWNAATLLCYAPVKENEDQRQETIIRKRGEEAWQMASWPRQSRDTLVKITRESLCSRVSHSAGWENRIY